MREYKRLIGFCHDWPLITLESLVIQTVTGGGEDKNG